MKTAQTFPLADAGFPCDIRHGNGFGKMLVDISEQPAEAEVVLIGRCLRQIHLRRKLLIQKKTDAGQVFPHGKFKTVVIPGKRLKSAAKQTCHLFIGIRAYVKAGKGGAGYEWGYIFLGKDRILFSADERRAENEGMQGTLRNCCRVMDDIGIDDKAVPSF